MIYGLFTCPYQRFPLEKAFADASAFGYSYIELWGGRPHAYVYDLLNGGLALILSLIERYNLPVAVYTPEHNAYPYNYMIGSEQQWESAMEYLTSAIRCGKELGAEYTLISVGHSGFASAVQKHARLLNTLRRLSEEAEKLGHRIVLESLTPMESDFCNTAEEVLSVLEELNSPVVYGMCDVVVPYIQHRDPVEEIRLLGSKMAHLHLTDSDGITETHLLPGDGVMDLAALVSGLKEIHYDGRATLELVTHYMDHPSEAAELAIRKMKELTNNEDSLYRRQLHRLL